MEWHNMCIGPNKFSYYQRPVLAFKIIEITGIKLIWSDWILGVRLCWEWNKLRLGMSIIRISEGRCKGGCVTPSLPQRSRATEDDN